jgi:hypothetical protein
MIEQADEHVREWVAKVLRGVSLSFSPPDGSGAERRVHAVLFGLERATGKRGPSGEPSPVTVLARYLMSVGGKDEEKAHEDLGTLVFAALQQEEFTVEFPDADRLAAVWTALGARLRPSFVLGRPVELTRRTPPAPPVHKHIYKFPAAVPLAGVVLGPEDIPLSGAKVEIRSLGVSARTDPRGRFRFALIPRTLEAGDMVVLAKGRECPAGAIEAPGDDKPLVIRVTGLES